MGSQQLSIGSLEWAFVSPRFSFAGSARCGPTRIAMRVTASIGIALLGSVFANQAQAGLPVAGLHQTAWVMTTPAAGSFLVAWRLRGR